MKILVLNCGSSSIKYKLYDMDNESVLAQGGVERIGIDGAFIKVTLPNGEKKQILLFHFTELHWNLQLTNLQNALNEDSVKFTA